MYRMLLLITLLLLELYSEYGPDSSILPQLITLVITRRPIRTLIPITLRVATELSRPRMAMQSAHIGSFDNNTRTAYH